MASQKHKRRPASPTAGMTESRWVDEVLRVNDDASALIHPDAPHRHGRLPFAVDGGNVRFNPNALVRENRKLLETVPKKTALEVPCGLGRDTFYLLSRGFDVTAVDVDQDVLDFISRSACKLKLPGRVGTVNAGLESLTFQKDFSVILSLNGLHYAQTRERGRQFIRGIQGHTLVGGLNVIQAANVLDPTPGRLAREEIGILDYRVEPEELKYTFFLSCVFWV